MRLFAHYKAGNIEGAPELYQIYLPLIRYEMQPDVGLDARKFVLQRQGLLANARQREPGYRLTNDDHAEIDRMLAWLDQRQAAE